MTDKPLSSRLRELADECEDYRPMMTFSPEVTKLCVAGFREAALALEAAESRIAELEASVHLSNAVALGEQLAASRGREGRLREALANWIHARDGVEHETTRPKPPAFSSAPMVVLMRAESEARKALEETAEGKR